MKINIPEEYRFKFKQELLSIVFLSFVQAILSFNFPVYIRLGSILRYVAWAGSVIVSIVAHTFSFSSAHKYYSYFELESFDLLPDAYVYAAIFKRLTKGSILAIGVIILYFYWFIDLYGMSNFEYFSLYFYYIITAVLFCRAVCRKPRAN